MPTPAAKPIITNSYTFTTIDEAGKPGTTLTGLNDLGTIIGYNGSDGFIDNNGTFTDLADPRATGVLGTHETFPQAINNQGVIAGDYEGASLGLGSSPSVFVLNHGTYTDIAGSAFPHGVPPNFGAAATGINSSAEVVGFVDPITIDVGFVYSNGKTTGLLVPSVATGINNQGDIVGDYGSGAFAALAHGFLDQHGVYTTIDFPGASATQLFGINNHDEIIGDYSTIGIASGVSPTPGGFALDTPHAFSYLNGKFTSIDVPGAVTTKAVALNNTGEVVGDYQTTTGGPEHGFVYQNGQFTRIDAPGAVSTEIVGVNSRGEIAGNYTDSSGVHHGFTAVDPHTFDFSSVSPSTFVPPASGIMLTDPSPTGASASMLMSTSLVDPSLLVTPHIPT